ncbi:MAG: class II fructose-bisphosphate aldolase [bacterium]
MNFVPMLDLIQKAWDKGYAVPSFCAWNADVMQAVLNVSQRLSAPVIIMNGPGEFFLMAPDIMGSVAQAVAKGYCVKAALHLDHGDSINQVKQCINAKYTSVMLDFSSRPFEENAKALCEVVRLAHPNGITVEGEIGAVGKVDSTTSEGGCSSTLTNPDEASRYVKETGVDVLAISIGNAHGNYTKLPQLDFNRLAAIHKAVDIPLVLHGGSGTPDDDIQRAISMGIAKVNVATDLVNAVRESLIKQWQSGQNQWVPSARIEAMREVEKVVEEWIHRTGAEGKAEA